jgi:hypothetical protein
MEMNEELLRKALEAEASRVSASPSALAGIRQRIARHESRSLFRGWHRVRASRPRRPRGAAMWWSGMVGAGTVTATVVAVMASVGSCNPVAGPAPDQAPPPAAASQTTASTSARVPIYYIGATKAGPRLYREYHVVAPRPAGTAAALKAAIAQMLDGRTAYDRDYHSSWPASATVRSVAVRDGVATIDLGGATVNGYDPKENAAALQQLIWTGTAYSGGTGVRLLFDGKPRATLWKAALPCSGVLRRAAAVSALAPVWVIDPQAGSLSGRNVTVNLAGIVFEGAVNVRVKNSAGRVVYHKVVQLTMGAPAQGTARLTVRLNPGAYTVEAWEVSMKDGSVVALDGHAFTVR